MIDIELRPKDTETYYVKVKGYYVPLERDRRENNIGGNVGFSLVIFISIFFSVLGLIQVIIH